MSDFKKNSSRFNRSSGGGSAGPSNYGGGQSRGSYGSRPSGGQPEARSYGSNRSSEGNAEGGKSFAFTRIGDLSYTKSVGPDLRAAFEELLNQGLQFNVKVWLGDKKGQAPNELVLKTGDFLLIDHKVTEKDKEFVRGHVSVKN